MKPNQDISYICYICHQPTTTLHELWRGAGRRQTCIKYNVQLPVCGLCHLKVDKDKLTREYYQQEFCKLAGVKWEDLQHYINNPKDYASKKVLEKYIDNFKKVLDSMQI